MVLVHREKFKSIFNSMKTSCAAISMRYLFLDGKCGELGYAYSRYVLVFFCSTFQNQGVINLCYENKVK